MEVVAALASVAQLTSYALYLVKAVSDIHERIENRPAYFRRRRRQLKLLESTLQDLIRNKVLTTPSVREHLEVISTRIESLNVLLDKEASRRTQGLFKKYFRAWIEDKTQQRVAEIFEDIESNKLALLLSIGETAAWVSGEIYSTVTEGFSSIHVPSDRKNVGKKSPRPHKDVEQQRDEDIPRYRITSQRQSKEEQGPNISFASMERNARWRVCGGQPRHNHCGKTERTSASAASASINNIRPLVHTDEDLPSSTLSQAQSTQTPKANQEIEMEARNGHSYSAIVLGKKTAFAVGNWGQSETNNAAPKYSRHTFGEIKAEENARGMIGDVYHVQSAKEIILGKKDKGGD